MDVCRGARASLSGGLPISGDVLFPIPFLLSLFPSSSFRYSNPPPFSERSGYLPPNRPIRLSPSFPPNPPAPKNPISHFKSLKHFIYVDKPVLY